MTEKSELGPPVEKLKWMLGKMYEIRFFEEAAGNLYRRGLLKGGVHACIGQEGVEVGISAHLRTDDYITSTHRGHGHHLAKGADPKRLMAELLGKESGYCKGRGGSMHVAAFEVGSLGAFPIVGAGVPSAVGAGFSIRQQGTDKVVVTYFGDGALGQGTVYEGMNLASIWKLPVIFACENNHYAVSSSIEDMIAMKDAPAFAASLGFCGVRVNGQDILEVYRAAGQAVERARSGSGPTLLFLDTYRFEGHYFGEPEGYRSREEVQKARTQIDPIPLFRSRLLESGVLNAESAQEIEQAALARVAEALAFAEASPEPAPEEYGRYVYA
jgi:TPP-dependent pyruvate/acetoin dehydrogenase alpha subunit